MTTSPGCVRSSTASTSRSCARRATTSRRTATTEQRQEGPARATRSDLRPVFGRPAARSVDMHAGDRQGVPENVSWNSDGVSFAAVHVVGSNNSLVPWTGNTAATPDQPVEVLGPHGVGPSADPSHVSSGPPRSVRAVALLIQADMFDPDGGLIELLGLLRVPADRCGDRPRGALPFRGPGPRVGWRQPCGPRRITPSIRPAMAHLRGSAGSEPDPGDGRRLDGTRRSG